MGRKIYNRFEILKQAPGSPGNMVYKTRDLGPAGVNADGSADEPVVQLLEWTPPQHAFTDCALKLVDARDDVPEVEVFSSGASLYIASPSATAALTALGKLQQKGLFPGEWPGADSAMSQEQWENYWARLEEIKQFDNGASSSPKMPQDLQAAEEGYRTEETEALPMPLPLREDAMNPPVAVPPPPKPVLQPNPQAPPKPPLPPNPQFVPPPLPPRPPMRVSQPNRWAAPLIIAVAIILAAAILGLALKERNRRIAEEQSQQHLARVHAADVERQEQQRKLDDARSAAEKQQKDLEERMRQAEIQHQRDLANERKQKEDAEARLRDQQEQERRRVEAAKAEKERDDQRRRIEIANAKAAQKRKDDLERQQEQERIDRQNAKAITDSFAQRQATLSAGLGNQFHRIRLINKCPSGAIQVAVHYQGLDQTWVTQGWWEVGPGQERPAPLVYSQNGTFYFYAEGDGKVWSGDDSSGLPIDIVENPFTHILGPIVGRNRRVVRAIRRDFSTGFGEHPVPFNCQN